jgi:hypothetical protein
VNIDWAAFGQVFVVSFGAGVGVIVLFAIGVSLLSRAPASARRPDGEADAGSDVLDAVPDVASSTTAGQLAAGLCFLACALTVLYGLYVIISR